jgi:hypothetical protein
MKKPKAPKPGKMKPAEVKRRIIVKDNKRRRKALQG